jgi:hypothetical protein
MLNKAGFVTKAECDLFYKLADDSGLTAKFQENPRRTDLLPEVKAIYQQWEDIVFG